MLGTLRDTLSILMATRSEAEAPDAIPVNESEFNTMAAEAQDLHDDDQQSNASSLPPAQQSKIFQATEAPFLPNQNRWAAITVYCFLKDSTTIRLTMRDT
jgi:hypothetical protein